MKNVLIVDDAEFMRMTIKQMLEGKVNVVGEAADGQEAVEKYKVLHPDIVLMDITMPVMSGIEALKEIKAYNPEARIIIVSAMGQEQTVREAILHGAETFIVKPFTGDRLIEVVLR